MHGGSFDPGQRERLAESLDRAGQHRFAGVECHPPAAQVEAARVAGRERGAQRLVARVGSGGHAGPATIRDAAQYFLGPVLLPRGCERVGGATIEQMAEQAVDYPFEQCPRRQSGREKERSPEHVQA